MIPKVIHYCWLSDDPYPKEIQRCINSWKKYLPDYEFIKWDFSRISKSDFKWVSDAFDNKKYAFAADYIRVYALYHYGGIYLDSDVEVIKSFNDLLKNPYFFCYEYGRDTIEAAVIGAQQHMPFYKYLLDYYNNQSFVGRDGSLFNRTIPSLMRDLISSKYRKFSIDNPDEIIDNPNNIYVLPFDYFSPKNFLDGKIYTTSRSYAIHHFQASWFPRYYQLEQTLWRAVGVRNLMLLWRIRNLFKYGSLRSYPKVNGKGI